ncbi:hypothetical protein ACHAXA_007533 [Cyclostephanos tholiformis]|uniref:Uncharacterized protein n=1 Tax=Cyclostephanos tholiformis TaxID=382380 RepID=A0ABD3SRL9_9STRA
MISSFTKIVTLAAVAAFVVASPTQAFVVIVPSSFSSSSLSSSSSSSSRRTSRSSPSSPPPLDAARGFASPPPSEPRKKSNGAIDREDKSNKYDEIISKTGGAGQEYRVFVRKFGSDDMSWLPVSDAIFANEDGLRNSIVRTYDRLRGMEMEFEYGYNLKIYPDDPIQVAMKRGIGGGSTSGPSIGNWISNLLSPVDTSGVVQPTSIKED